jgi:hypothetical protein
MAQIMLDLPDENKLIVERLVNVVRTERALSGKVAGETWGRMAPLSSKAIADAHPETKIWDATLMQVFAGTKPPPPPPVPQLGPWGTGPIVFNNGVPVGGWSSLTLFSNGGFDFVRPFP